jgi:hypothetical protein
VQHLCQQQDMSKAEVIRGGIVAMCERHGIDATDDMPEPGEHNRKK